MKPVLLIFAVLILLGAAAAYYLHGVARGAKIIIIMNRLTQASGDLKKRGAFTNDISTFCDIHAYTEHQSVGATDYQCALAATSLGLLGRTSRISDHAPMTPGMKPERHRGVRCIRFVLPIAALALANRPVRVWCHRMRLRSDMSFEPFYPKSVNDHSSVNYWKWRLLTSCVA